LERVLLYDPFGRDQHEALIRQLFHIRQTGPVAEYVEQFSGLVDQLAAYEFHSNSLYYAMRFVDGLRDDIKSMVMIQRPATLDSACALALVQEEAMESGRKKEYRRSEPFSHRSVQRSGDSQSALSRQDKSLEVVSPDDKRTTEAAQVGSADDKLRALRQYRHARGLCDRCAEK
jgi:hypothetical protein